MELQTIFEDDFLVVLNKPAGMVVNRAESVRGKTVQEQMEEYLQITNDKLQMTNEAEELFLQRSGMVHRLDKETSGLLLWAKTSDVLAELLRQFKAREVRKEYLALVHGKLEPKIGFVGVPIARDTEYRGRFCVDPLGKPAFTKYSVSEYLEMANDTLPMTNQIFSLLSLFPKTGRTHQIRVHMKHLGHPLVSDVLYLSKKSLKHDLAWCSRLFLHAAKIDFAHPVSGERVMFEAGLSEDLHLALSFGRLQKHD